MNKQTRAFSLSVVITSLMLLVGCGEEAAPIQNQTLAERNAEVAQVLNAPVEKTGNANEKQAKQVVPDEVVKAIEKRFVDFSKACQSKSASMGTDFFDFLPLVKLMIKASGERNTARLRNTMINGMTAGMNQRFVAGDVIDLIKPIKVIAVLPIDNKSVAVYTKHYDTSYALIQIKWWLTFKDQEWRIYDFEEVATGITWSTQVVQILSGANGLNNIKTNTQHYKRVMEIYNKLGVLSDQISEYELNDQQKKTVEQCKSDLENIRFDQTMSDLEALRWTGLSMCEMYLGNNEASMQALDNSDTHREGMLLNDLLRGSVYSIMEKHAEAIESFDEYIKLAGYDSNVCNIYATSLIALDKIDEAKVVLKKAIDELPEDIDSLLAYIALAESDEKQIIKDCIGRMIQPEIWFDLIGDSLLYEQDYEALAIAVEAFRDIAPNHVDTLYYSGSYEFYNNDYEAAANYYRKALAVAEGDNVDACENSYYRAMTCAKQWQKAYEEAADFEEAYAIISSKLYDLEMIAELDAFSAKHLDKYPNDYVAAYYLGTAKSMQGDYEQASNLFDRYMDHEMTGDDRYEFMVKYIDAMCKWGKWNEGYERFKGSEAAFDHVANYLQDEEKYHEMDAFVTSYSATQEKQNVWYWQSMYMRATEQWDNLFAHLNTYRKHIKFDDTAGLLMRMHVESSIKIGKLDDAMELAKEYAESSGSRFFEFAVAVQQEDVDLATSIAKNIIEKYGEEELEYVFNDTLLDDKLELKKFEDLLEQFGYESHPKDDE